MRTGCASTSRWGVLHPLEIESLAVTPSRSGRGETNLMPVVYENLRGLSDSLCARVHVPTMGERAFK